MALYDKALVKTDNLPIKHTGDIHSGKVRSVYWLTDEDNKSLCSRYGLENEELAVMVISDRISAYECIWQSEGGLKGIPGKGAALNAIAHYWFRRFEEEDLAGNHIVDVPHPLVWLVRKARPVMVEAIARQYITGSMWRGYEKGERDICGIKLPEGLKKNQKLNELLITPSTKGIITGVEGIPEIDDVNITRDQILANLDVFNFRSEEDVSTYEKLLTEGFNLISSELDKIGKVFVDTKFEFGFIGEGADTKMIYIDEIGTPDSSRYWDKNLYEKGEIREDSKEFFREMLQASVPDKDVLLNKSRMDERAALADTFRLKDEQMMEVSRLYVGLAEEITGEKLPLSDSPKTEIVEALAELGLIK
ncbi:MAG: phosphoribosylaminoimidazolesuccinocarboxamide synthase [Spirochaetales bacterium]|uniref:Phosphoribosylaminoimidazole-succinocarboxamide synthase n=1 Tax=Candidatus Thalassospirochaeta sargassi TaxID=3119039 RepID=A0AAJ1IGY2_9SPIO|nr:phosphoribosylaminoimidazolesuccinocarboxamide synthase [Spirochaetales bacterium]